MAGRPLKNPDSLQSATAEDEIVKSKIREYLAKNIDSMLADIDELPLKERAAARQKLLDYVMPKVQAVRTEKANSQSAGDFLLEQEAGLLLD